MKLYSKLFILAIAVASVLPVKAQSSDSYFPYPTPPDTMEMFQDRANYFVAHFWDRCPMKSAFSSRDRMRDALEDYIQMLPNATDSIAFQSVNTFVKSLAKQPKDQIFVVNEAERQLYSDSAQFLSDDLYIAFAKPMLENKKVAKESKLRHERLVRILEGSANGVKPPVLSYVTREGQKGSTADDFGQIVVYFFNDPDCGDCALTRARLMADVKARQMIENGSLKIVSIYPGEFDDEWKEKVADYPEAWKVVAAEDADDIYDLRMTPTFYIIYRGKIWGKGLNVAQVLTVLNSL